jgi:hypothetical protein
MQGRDDDTPSLGFTWQRRKDGAVEIRHHGRLAATLRGQDAQAFLEDAEGGDAEAAQQAMARLTGNYKHGNERTAAEHPRNRR